MAQIFHRSTNTIARVSIYGAVILLAIAGYLGYAINTSPYFTEVNNARPQPVPFSHKHHVGELGLDCRYCHTTVEDSAFGRHASHANLHDLPFADLDRAARCSSRCAPATGTTSRFPGRA